MSMSSTKPFPEAPVAMPAVRSIASVAIGAMQFENAEPFQCRSEVALSQALFQHDQAKLLHAATATASVRGFTLENVVLDADTLMVCKDGSLIGETAVFAPPEARQPFDDPGIAAPEDDGSDIILGYNPLHFRYLNWVTQCLPAIDWCMRAQGDRPVRLLLPPLASWQEEFLHLLGYDRVPRLTLERNTRYRLSRLHIAEFLTGAHNGLVSMSLRHTLGRIAAAVPSTGPTAPVLYVPGSYYYYGALSNEAELVKLLSQIGIGMVIPSLTVAQRVNLFRNAQVVIGPLGHALVDVGFCRPRSLLWELMPRHHLDASVNRIAQSGGMDYLGDVFPVGGGPIVPGEWQVDMALVRQRLQQISERLARMAASRPQAPAQAPSQQGQGAYPQAPRPVTPMVPSQGAMPAFSTPLSPAAAAPPGAGLSPPPFPTPASSPPTTAAAVPLAPPAAAAPPAPPAVAPVFGASVGAPLAPPGSAAPSPPAATTAAAAETREYESLGDGSVPWLAQPDAPSALRGLLQMAWFDAAADSRLDRLVAALEQGFEGLGSPDTITLVPETWNGQSVLVAHDTIYGLRFHTGLIEGAVSPDRAAAEAANRLSFLCHKLIDDMLSGRKVWVWNCPATTHPAQLQPLLRVLRRLGPNVLLWVTTADGAHPAGTIDPLADDFLRGYAASLGGSGTVADVASWQAIRAMAERWLDAKAGGPAEAPLGPFPPIEPPSPPQASATDALLAAEEEVQGVADPVTLVAEGGDAAAAEPVEAVETPHVPADDAAAPGQQQTALVPAPEPAAPEAAARPLSAMEYLTRNPAPVAPPSRPPPKRSLLGRLFGGG